MRITILTIGSRGDVQPYIGLGLGLQQRGHAVTIATHANYRALIKQYGLAHRPIAGNPQELLNQEIGQRWLETGKNSYQFVKQLVAFARPKMTQAMEDIQAACQDAEVILFQVLATVAALSMAEKLNIPAIPAFLQHIHPTRAFPNAMALPPSPLGGLYNWLTYPVSEQLFWQVMRSAVNTWRVENLHLPPLPLRGPFGPLRKARQLCLYGFSPHVIPKPVEWRAEIHITGYWFAETLDGWQPPDNLVDFLASGSAPVYIGFGSMTDRNSAQITKIALEALRLTGERGLLLTGWGGLSQADLPDNVFKIEAAPHDWLFPQMAAVVHHGGAGTTAAGLRAGVPSIVVPFFGDQPFWGWRVQQLGVGPKPIPRKQLTARRLAAAITTSVRDVGMRHRAAHLGAQIRSEDGPATAATLFDRYMRLSQ